VAAESCDHQPRRGRTFPLTPAPPTPQTPERVFVAQAKGYADQGTPRTALPLSREPLAGLAADERLHLT